MSDIDRREIFHRIANEAGTVRAIFPTHAEAALKVRRAIENPNCTIEQAAHLIQAEPLLAARVVAMANSVACNRTGREITDVKQAVTRLGFRTIRALATAVVVQQMMSAPTDPWHRALAEQLWEHTTHVAALAHVIARHVTHLDHETALFIGIVHEVGGFYLLARAHEFPGLLEGARDNLAAAWHGESEAQVGRAVLKALGVPDPAQLAIEAYWQGYLAFPPVSLGDTLLLANELAPVPSPLLRETPDEHDAQRRANIELALGDQTLSGILGEAAEEVQSLVAALS